MLRLVLWLGLHTFLTAFVHFFLKETVIREYEHAGMPAELHDIWSYSIGAFFVGLLIHLLVLLVTLIGMFFLSERTRCEWVVGVLTLAQVVLIFLQGMWLHRVLQL